MLATDAKMQKIETGLNFFYDGRKFHTQSVNVIDNVISHLFFNVWKNFGLCAKTLSDSFIKSHMLPPGGGWFHF